MTWRPRCSLPHALQHMQLALDETGIYILEEKRRDRQGTSPAGTSKYP